MESTDNFKQRLTADLKTALLSGNKERAEVLRAMKSAVLYEEVAKGIRDSGLPDDDILRILSKEAKKRQESADLYVQGGNQERADAELAEKKIIEEYLPAQLSEADISALLDAIVAEQGPVSKETMGAIIAAVKQRSQGAADGAVIARLVKERLTQGAQS